MAQKYDIDTVSVQMTVTSTIVTPVTDPESYDKAYNVGYGEGYNVGYSEGHNIGHTEGLELGETKGYNAGREALEGELLGGAW